MKCLCRVKVTLFTLCLFSFALRVSVSFPNMGGPAKDWAPLTKSITLWKSQRHRSVQPHPHRLNPRPAPHPRSTQQATSCGSPLQSLSRTATHTGFLSPPSPLTGLGPRARENRAKHSHIRLRPRTATVSVQFRRIHTSVYSMLERHLLIRLVILIPTLLPSHCGRTAFFSVQVAPQERRTCAASSAASRSNPSMAFTPCPLAVVAGSAAPSPKPGTPPADTPFGPWWAACCAVARVGSALTCSAAPTAGCVMGTETGTERETETGASSAVSIALSDDTPGTPPPTDAIEAVAVAAGAGIAGDAVDTAGAAVDTAAAAADAAAEAEATTSERTAAAARASASESWLAAAAGMAALLATPARVMGVSRSMYGRPRTRMWPWFAMAAASSIGERLA